jgi:hypothetical protein
MYLSLLFSAISSVVLTENAKGPESFGVKRGGSLPGPSYSEVAP